MAVRQEWDLRRVLIIITRNWWWPVLTLSVAVFAAWGYLRYAEAAYKSDATVQIDLSANPSLLGKKMESSALISFESMLEAYLELFLVYDLIAEVVDTLRLDWEVYSVGKVGRSLVFPTPFWIEGETAEAESLLKSQGFMELRLEQGGRYTLGKNDSVWARGVIGEWVSYKQGPRIRIRETEAPLANPGTYEIHHIPYKVAVASWQNRVSVVPKRGLTVLQVSVVDKSPARAARFLFMLLELSREHERSIRQVQYEKALRYVDTLLAFMKAELSLAQDTLLSVERRSEAPFIPARREYILRLFSEVYGENESIYFLYVDKLDKYIQSVLDTLRYAPDSPLSVLPVWADIEEDFRSRIEKINELIERRTNLLRVYQAGSPPVESVNYLLGQLLSQLLQAVRETRQGRAYAKAHAQRQFLQGKERVYQDILRERQFSILQEDMSLRREIYKVLLERKIQLSIDKEAVVSSIRITQPPMVPSKPLYPNPFQVYVMALIGGFVLGFGGVIFRSVLSQTLSYRVDMENISPIPLIGELPYVRTSVEEKGWMLSGLQLEVLRSLRGALGFLWEEGKPRVLVVTSTVSGEGKTFVAKSLAHVYALAGHRVLLIDADLRRASLSQQAGQRERGLSLFLARASGGMQTIEELVIPFEREGLYFLSAGPAAPNPPELLENPLFGQLVEELSSSFDYIIIDTAPVGLVPDTLSLIQQLPYAVTVYVFRADYSRINFLNHLEELIKKHHISKVYLLFNGTKLNKATYGYGYGYGYYGEGYGKSYYYKSPSPSSLWDRFREWLPV
ncbi:MAG: polysaccharide biosynthesis tyrosine autokinase [Bacteroidia bacterium]|nr:polysaccharide biosynthesis tyrosine autokinase [Bacteroidia bacterium]